MCIRILFTNFYLLSYGGNVYSIMKEKWRNRTSLYLLLVYLPVAIGVSFIHSHSLAFSAENEQYSASNTKALSAASADLTCVICKFLSSHSSVANATFDEYFEPDSLDFSVNLTLITVRADQVPSDRAPPFSA